MKNVNLLYLFLSVTVIGCSQPEINFDFDKTVNFKSYHSFSLCLPERDSLNTFDNAESRSIIANAISAEMSKFYNINDINPELTVNVKIIIKQKKVYFKSCERGDNYKTWPDCHIENREFTEGTLIVYV